MFGKMELHKELQPECHGAEVAFQQGKVFSRPGVVITVTTRFDRLSTGYCPLVHFRVSNVSGPL